MSASSRILAGAGAIGLCCCALAVAVAQQSTDRPQPAQSDALIPIGRSDQATAPQADRFQTDRVVPGRQPYTANYNATENNTGQALAENYFANCLLKHNEAEVEFAKMAVEQSQNARVKQFAQMLVKDHQKVIDQLQPIVNTGAFGKKAAAAIDATGAATANREIVAAPGLPASPTNDATTTPDARIGTTAKHGMHGGALLEVAAIEQKISDRCKQALREELESKTGAEFDECFVGSQIGGHMHMLAALEVLSQEGQGQVKQIADSARPTVQMHLNQAKQLAKDLKSTGQNAATAQRPATSTERQQ